MNSQFKIFALFLVAGLSFCTAAAQRSYFQGFENDGDTWKSDFKGGQWSMPNPDLVAQVAHKPHAGAKCIRGNLWGKVADPVTKIQGNGESGWLQFEWAP